MARYFPIKNSFVAGELSPRLEAADYLDQYFQGMRRAINGVVLPHGGFMRRSGTRFAEKPKYRHLSVRMEDFEVSVEQAYAVEWGDGYARFFANEGQLVDGMGFPVEVSTPFIEDDLQDLHFAQDNDVQWVASTNHHPAILSRTSTSVFTFTKVVWKNGHAPMRPDNTTSTTLTVGSTSILTFSASVGLTDYDVGRAVRWATSSSNTAWYEITSVTSGSVAQSVLRGGSTVSGSATTNWSLGMYSNSEGPRSVQFVQGRLGYFGSNTIKNWWQLSKSDDFDDFDLGDASDDFAIARRVSAGRTDAIQWAQSADENLVIGTTGTEFKVSGDVDGLLVPSATQAQPSTARGSAHIQALNVDAEILFVQRNQRKLRVWTYDLQKDGRVARDVSILAEHILQAGVNELHYQQDPDSVVWCLRTDGVLVGFTYEREQKVNGAHRQIVGGSYNSGAPIIESGCVIPAPSGDQDQLWLSVLRTIDGRDERYIEFFTPPFRPNLDIEATPEERSIALEGTPFSDCSLTLDDPIELIAISNSATAVFQTRGAHGFATGDTVRLRMIESLASDDDDVTALSELNNRSYTVSVIGPDTFSLLDADDEVVDTSAMNGYIGSGVVYLETQLVTGLEHLEGQTVDVQADGQALTPTVVSNGTISLETPASIIHVGCNYVTSGETMRFIGGNRAGTDQGRRQRIQRVIARVLETIGVEFRQGPDSTVALEAKPVHFDGDPMDRSPPVFTGDIELSPRSSWNADPTVYFEQSNPLPMTILAIMPYAESR